MFRKITFLVVASLLIFSSCEQEGIISTENLDNNTENEIFAPKQDVLFHYGFENESTGELKGWVIDKHGIVRTYDFTNATNPPELPSSKDVDEEIMNNLFNHSTPTDLQIDLEVLEANYKKINTAANGRIDLEEEGTIGDGTTSIMAYHYVEVCDDYNPTHHQMITLETFGETNKVNARPAAAALVDWLKEIQANENP